MSNGMYPHYGIEMRAHEAEMLVGGEDAVQ